MELSDRRREVLAELLRERQTGDPEVDWPAAGREVWRRRQRNTDDGGEVIDALLEMGYSLHQIERETKIPVNTARRWKTPPDEADGESS